MKKIKKRFPILIAVLVLMIAGALTYVAMEGNTYTECLFWHQNDYLTEDQIKVTVADESVVKAERVYFDKDHHICIDLTSVNPGDTKLTVYESGSKLTDIPLYVTQNGTIIQRTYLSFDGFFMMQIVIIACTGLIFAVMIFSFFECFKKAMFSYSMVAYGGLALFCAYLMAITIYKMQWMNNFRSFLQDFLTSGYYFTMYTSVFMFFFCLCFAFSNIWLLRHEGFRWQNMLGIMLAVLWTGWCLWIFLSWGPWYFDTPWHYDLSNSLGFVSALMECLLLSTIVCAFLATRHKPSFDRDYLVILGCCIRSDGSLTPILKGRADAAISFERKQFAATGRHAKFVPSGGQGADEVISESEAMARYLKEQGYPEEQIIKEDKSVNTDQNIRFSRDKIKEDAGTLDNIKAGIATTNYHIFRSYTLSQKHGLDAQGISAKTKWYFFPNAFLREFTGLLMEKKIALAVVIVLLIVTYLIGHRLMNLAITAF